MTHRNLNRSVPGFAAANCEVLGAAGSRVASPPDSATHTRTAGVRQMFAALDLA